MRILLLSLVYPPPSDGGAIVVYEIAQALSGLGNDVAVVAPKIEFQGMAQGGVQLGEKARVTRVQVPFADRPKVAARACYANMLNSSLELAKEFKPDFILTFFHPFHRVTHAAVECAKRLSIPSLVKVEDIAFEAPKGLLKKVQRGVEQKSNAKALNATSHVFVVNDYVAGRAKELYGVDGRKISILPNGVSTDRFQVLRKGTGKTVVFTGVMYYHRGLDFLIENAQEIVERNDGARFKLVGSGPELAKLQELVKKKKLDLYFEFTGWVGWPQIPGILAGAAIGLGPLKHTQVTHQALPIKVLEYMASGLPVVALENTLPENVLKHGMNGYFVKDGGDFVDKVSKLLADESLNAEMGKRSREIVEKDFDWRILVKKIIDGYKK